MGLKDLFRRYAAANTATHSIISQPATPHPATKEQFELPLDPTDWPMVLRVKLTANIETLRTAFGLTASEAEKAAELGMRANNHWQRIRKDKERQCNDTPEDGSDDGKSQ